MLFGKPLTTQEGVAGKAALRSKVMNSSFLEPFRGIEITLFIV